MVRRHGWMLVREVRIVGIIRRFAQRFTKRMALVSRISTKNWDRSHVQGGDL